MKFTGNETFQEKIARVAVPATFRRWVLLGLQKVYDFCIYNPKCTCLFVMSGRFPLDLSVEVQHFLYVFEKMIMEIHRHIQNNVLCSMSGATNNACGAARSMPQGRVINHKFERHMSINLREYSSF